MKIPFMLKFPWGEETHFIEKLWAMAYYYNLIPSNKELFAYRLMSPVDFHKILPTEHLLDVTVPKLHTIRNKSDRYKVDQFVQPFIWTYKPYKANPNPLIPAQFNFMPPLKIVSKQTFDIIHIVVDQKQINHVVFIDNIVFYDSLYGTDRGMLQFAINDGFNSIEHFFKYFNEPVNDMEIRHFTNLKY